MSNNKLYAVALLAVRPCCDMKTCIDAVSWSFEAYRRRVGFYPDHLSFDRLVELSGSHEFLLAADMTLAASVVDALETCLTRFREQYPESEGWTPKLLHGKSVLVGNNK